VSDAASFLAAFPAIQSAIKVYGDRQGMRVQLDIPESEMGEAVKLLMWREQVLRVTVEPEKHDGQRNHRQIHI
jgi:aromatic ring-cleaving dioxygenase